MAKKKKLEPRDDRTVPGMGYLAVLDKPDEAIQERAERIADFIEVYLRLSGLYSDGCVAQALIILLFDMFREAGATQEQVRGIMLKSIESCLDKAQ